jgi:hypothetical protein
MAVERQWSNVCRALIRLEMSRFHEQVHMQGASQCFCWGGVSAESAIIFAQGACRINRPEAKTPCNSGFMSVKLRVFD